MTGEGEAGEMGGPRGDLYVMIHVKEHEIFERRDANLYTSYNLSFTQSALGSEVVVPTLEGEETLKIPEGTQTGSIFRVKGKGMPALGGRGRGDLFVSINVVTPTRLNRDQKRLLEELAKLEAANQNEEDKGIFNKVKDIFG
jgi:molecular chaperone DnaJ